MEVGFYGKLLDDSEVLKMAEERFGKPTLLMKLPMLTMHLLVS